MIHSPAQCQSFLETRTSRWRIAQPDMSKAEQVKGVGLTPNITTARPRRQLDSGSCVPDRTRSIGNRESDAPKAEQELDSLDEVAARLRQSHVCLRFGLRGCKVVIGGVKGIQSDLGGAPLR
jgi:hypothetical protein